MKHRTSRRPRATGSSGVANAISAIRRKADQTRARADKTATGRTAIIADSAAPRPSSAPWTQNGGQGSRFHNGLQGSDNLEPLRPREDAPTRIFCLIDDLFFLAKIQEVARKLNVKVEFVKSEKEFDEREGQENEEKPSLIIVDLNINSIKPLPVISKLRSKFKKPTSILGFVSHVQGDLKIKAQEAGCDVVMPRSAFSQNLPSILRRHGAEDEPEDNTFNKA